MVAASQSAKSITLINEIAERNNPMPSLMLQQILQGRSLVSVFEQMNSERDYYRAVWNKLHNQLTEDVPV